ncbi:DUF4405 domain-containing protein [Celeribacter sp.]|uniref:DUF4405 domain-containing protein n=1 Tax=Celeribacter sp. TaxID=1890673 RepID=UPI003A93279A
MSINSTLRKFATPLTVGTFLVTGVTGTLWYFHIVTDAGRWLHEIIGLVMMGAVALHLILNWRAFLTYFKRPIALVLMIGFLAMTIGGYVIPESETEGGPRGGVAAIMMFGEKDLATLAPVFGVDADGLTSKMIAAGYEDATATSTVIDLVGAEPGKLLNAFAVMGE